jgi:glycosyltransferase involved in cell wall biosynthesis
MLSNKKILFLDHFNCHGGAQEYVLDIVRQLRIMGVDAVIPEIPINTLKDRAYGLPTIGFTILSKNFRKPRFYLRFIKSVFRLKKYLSTNYTDIIHCNSIPALVLAKCVKRRRHKIVLTCHDCNFTPFRIYLVKKCADAIICVSGAVKNYLLNHGVKQEKCVIYNGFAGTDLEPQKNPKQPNNQITFGIIGRIEIWKGIRLFIEAAQKTATHWENKVKFLIIGSSRDLSYYSELQDMSSGKNYIEFKPFEINKSEIYSQLDVVVNASLEIEPFGRTLVEAGLFGIPAIGPDQGGPAEIIDDGITGLLFETGNSNSLAQKMVLLIKSEELRRTLGDNGRKIYREKFSIDAVCREIIDFYQRTFHDT